MTNMQLDTCQMWIRRADSELHLQIYLGDAFVQSERDCQEVYF